MGEKIRLAKYLSQAGLASRRHAEELIKSSVIKVNGKIVSDVLTFIDPDKDRVFYKKKELKLQNKFIYLILNKPIHYLSSHKSQGGNKTIFDLLEKKYQEEKLIIVGRLDKESRGLILLTNNGELAHKLMHPKFQIEKEYIVKVKGIIKENFILKLLKGMKIEGEFYRAKKVDLINKNTVRIVLTEGKKREIRKMIDYLSYSVKDLFRVALGPIKLQNLASGKYRELKNNEIIELEKLC